MRGSRPSLLLVEDEMLISLEMAHTLETMGCDIVGPASHLDTALELAAKEPIDFGILDVNLQQVTSFPVAEVLTRRQIPFMFLTGDTASIISDYASVPVLSKPVLLIELRRVLSRYVRLPQ